MTFFFVTYCYTDGLKLTTCAWSSKLKSTVKGSVQTENKKTVPKRARREKWGGRETDRCQLFDYTPQAWQEIEFKSHSQVSYPISFLSRVWNTSDLKIHFVCKIPIENLFECQLFFKIIFHKANI